MQMSMVESLKRHTLLNVHSQILGEQALSMTAVPFYNMFERKLALYLTYLCIFLLNSYLVGLSWCIGNLRKQSGLKK